MRLVAHTHTCAHAHTHARKHTTPNLCAFVHKARQEELENKEKILRLKQELQERDAEKASLVRQLEDRDTNLHLQVGRLQYELNQALTDAESAASQLNTVDTMNNELKSELARSRDEVDRLVRSREKLVAGLNQTLRPEQRMVLKNAYDEQEQELLLPMGREKTEDRAVHAVQLELESWRMKEKTYLKRAEHSNRRIEEMEREMEELRLKLRQSERIIDEERLRNAQQGLEIKQQFKALREAHLLRRPSALNAKKVVRPVLASTRKSRQQETAVIKEGWLTKESGPTRSWKRRWVVVQEGNLYYYEDQAKTKPKGCILLEDCFVVPADKETKKDHTFSIYHSTRRTFYFQASDRRELDAWMSTIIEATHGLSKQAEQSKPGPPLRSSSSSSVPTSASFRPLFMGVIDGLF